MSWILDSVVVADARADLSISLLSGRQFFFFLGLFFRLMIDPQSALIGALAIYAVIVHILLSYLYASLKYSKDTLNAQEKDLTQ